MVLKLRFIHLPFSYIRDVNVITETGREYSAKTASEMPEIFKKINQNSETIHSFKFSTNNRRLKSEVKKYLEDIFSRHFK